MEIKDEPKGERKRGWETGKGTKNRERGWETGRNTGKRKRGLLTSILEPGPVLCRDEMEDWSSSESNLFEEAIEKYGNCLLYTSDAADE